MRAIAAMRCVVDLCAPLLALAVLACASSPAGTSLPPVRVISVAFSPDGKTLAAGSGEALVSIHLGTETPGDGKPVSLRRWDVATGAVVRDLAAEG